MFAQRLGSNSGYDGGISRALTGAFTPSPHIDLPNQRIKKNNQFQHPTSLQPWRPTPALRHGAQNRLGANLATCFHTGPFTHIAKVAAFTSRRSVDRVGVIYQTFFLNGQVVQIVGGCWKKSSFQVCMHDTTETIMEMPRSQR